MRSSPNKREGRLVRWRVRVAVILVVVMALMSGCFLDHEVEQYYGSILAPRAQEFRWSDGGLPRVFDPAMAAVPPDTDAVRAMFEGLTEYDSKSLAPVPGVASRWESSADNREWTFHLRRDARWSNNDPVTAHDFVRSWQRTLELGDRAPHARLLRNIQGATPVEPIVVPEQPATQPQSPPRTPDEEQIAKKESKQEIPQPKLGVEAVDDYTLRVRLVQADASFPALVSHPVFRPFHSSDESSAKVDGPATPQLVSNGAFHLTKIAADGVVLERAKNYWDAQAVSLERVHFVSTQDAESALRAYRAGEVDAVSNAGFEPLALKLLAPYKDFRRATFGALTYYSFNTSRSPFSDARIREALSLTIDRDRISEDELGGATEPAKRFLPAQMSQPGDSDHVRTPLIERDVERARKLLADAGYPGGQNFPRIRLLINRNAQQRQVAEAIAEMWRSGLGIETEIVPKDWNEYETAFRAGDYDIARRSYVIQSADESSSLRDMLEPAQPLAVDKTIETPAGAPDKNGEGGEDARIATQAQPPLPISPPPAISETQAVREHPAMPIYFASSYALVKPYVVGFDTNLLDAPSLKRVRIDTTWQQPKQANVIWFKAGE
ncbi:MAG: oligopeptide transport system substrate-binding protein [Acidobacteriota bacterium]|nr:oligopeptide transport system substrate-binding protein [Acidobacteriota bacterium]